MYMLRFMDSRQDPVWVVERQFTLGSAPDCHLVVSDPAVAPVHARLSREDGRLYLRDNNSPGGTFVNDQRVTRRELLPGDVIGLGTVRLEVAAETAASGWRLVADRRWLPAGNYPVSTEPVLIGRGGHCDITIPGSHLSREHAEVRVVGDRLRVRDLGSANGTYLNDNPVEDALAAAGDKLRLDVYSFEVVGPEPEPAAAPPRPKGPIREVVKRQVSATPKRWKIGPTSLGNRIEPPQRRSTFPLPWLVVAVVALALAVSTGVYLWLQG